MTLAEKGAADRPAVGRLLSAAEVAGLVSVSVKRVYELGIPAVRLSTRSLRWQLNDVLTWIEERREQR